MKTITTLLRITTLALVFFFGLSSAYAWTAPTTNPPNGNVSAPINTGTTAQYIAGSLGIEGLLRGYSTASIGTAGTCCASGSPTIGISEDTGTNNKLPWIQFHAAGFQEAFMRLAKNTRTFEFGDNQGIGVDLAIMNPAGTSKSTLLSGKGDSYIQGGNVGIGTAIPGVKLHVTDPTASTVARIESVAAGTSAQLNINSSAAGYPHILFTQGGVGRFEIGQVANNGNFYFNNNTQSGEGGAAMVISKTGNVGIGVPTPSRNLDIKQTTDDVNSGLGIQNMAGGTRLNLFKVGDTGYVYSGGTGEFPLVLGGTGNVGVGTTIPGAKLEVAGQVKITGGAPGLNKVLTSDASGLASWATPSAIAETDPKVGTLTTSYVPRWGGTSLANGSIFDNGTNVGIGTTAPGAYKLNVNGNTNFAGTLNASGNITANAGFNISNGNLLSTYFGTGSNIGNNRLEIGLGDPRQRLAIGVAGWSGMESKVTIHNDQQPGVAPLFYPIDANKYSLLVTHNSGGLLG